MATINGTNANDQLFGTSENDLIFGLAGNDLMFGDVGNDDLDGGLGADTMRGGSGSDTYRVDNRNDLIIENPNEGEDTVLVSPNSGITSFTLGANIENLEVSDGTPVGTGNELNNRIIASTIGNASFTLSGLGGNDTLIGNRGNDLLDGGTGNDTMSGNGGNDTYRVDSLGDVVSEAVNGGIDTVTSTIDYTLVANVENLKLVGSDNLSGTGNELDNDIRGNSGNNTLKGGAGNDTLGDRDNFVNNFESPTGLLDFGDFGNDVLDGGTGADRMAGGIGNDLYIVDNVGDVVIEIADIPDPEGGGFFLGGVDTVESSVNFTLGRFVENLTLTGTALNGSGNELNNVITGNSRANVLEGAAGNDSLLGGNGNDILRGGSGNDILVGGRGADTLTGGEGADSFVFDIGAPYNQAAMGKDVIRDFVAGVDRIVLDQTTFGPISRTDIALVANDADAAISQKKITYSEATGRLFFNANGSTRGFGAGGYFATLQGTPSLSVSDIAIQS